jgi:anthranilate synthase/aminodeoxychorismate synthase-like glutamine amidotransferase
LGFDVSTFRIVLQCAVLLILDNYDSFTFNLVQRVGEVNRSLEVRVVRNDAISVDEAQALMPTHLIISPGPGSPRETGVCRQLVEHFRGRAAILGVCLGHQVIADVHGVPVGRHHKPMHGKTSIIHHDEQGIFAGLPNPFPAARYHSLIVRRDHVPSEFEVSAWTADDEVMGLRWRGRGAAMDGVQFHPESYLTEVGRALLANFLQAPTDLLLVESTPVRSASQ